MFTYLYYLISVPVYGAALGICCFAYGRLGRKDLKYAGFMMFTRVCDAVYVIAMDLLGIPYAMHPLELTAALTLTVVKIYLLGRIVYTLFDRPLPGSFDILLCMIVILHGLLSTYPREVYWNLEPLSFSISILIVCGAYWVQWVQEENRSRRAFASRYEPVILVMLAFSTLELLYIVTSFSLMQAPLSQHYIDLFTNCFYMLLAVWYIVFCVQGLAEDGAAPAERCREDGLYAGKAGESGTPAPCFDGPDLPAASAARVRLAALCQQYELTEREGEILTLILSGKSNQEISDALYITVGTVKAHIHRIFGKLEVSSRSQLMTRFWTVPAAAESVPLPVLEERLAGMKPN